MRFIKVIFAFAFLAVLCRSFITPHLETALSFEGIYETIMHSLVGFLILVPFYDWRQELGPSRWYGVVGLVLIFWEVALIWVQKYGWPF